MKRINIVLLGLVLILNLGCEKELMENASISTLEVEEILPYKAKCGGVINSDGKLVVLSRGVCWNENPFPTLENLNTVYTQDGEGFGTYESILTNLNAGKTYYLRAYYTNENGIVYGEQVEFTTPDFIQYNEELNYGSVTDIDGNIYKTIAIGDQIWMAENLRTTHYQNGDTVIYNTDPKFWSRFGSGSGAYTSFDYDNSRTAIFGLYYNWHVASDSRNIAPEGWRVATKEDWDELFKYCGSTYDEEVGYKLREKTTAHWRTFTSREATNEFGFTSLGANYARTAGTSKWFFGYFAFYWTASGSPDFPTGVVIDDEVDQYFMDPYFGYNIRCVKN